MQEAGVGPEDIHYVNLHGTSTDLNDRIETRALKLALGDNRAHQVPMSALKRLCHAAARNETANRSQINDVDVAV
jgi:3-oxoacyl-[acyl-carrier-protein] synthase II